MSKASDRWASEKTRGGFPADEVISALQKEIRRGNTENAVRYLCECPKDRSSDEMALWVRLATSRGQAAPLIPDYALDMHTSAGKRAGRDLRHFMEIGARVIPEVPDRNTIYRQRILEMLAPSVEGDE